MARDFLNPTTEYTHLLPKEHQAGGYRLYAHDLPGDNRRRNVAIALYHPSDEKPVGGIWGNVSPAGDVGDVEDDDLYMHPQHHGRPAAEAMVNALYAHADKRKVPSLETQRTKKQLLDAAGGDLEAVKDALRAEVARRGLSEEFGVAPPDAAPQPEPPKAAKPKLGVVDGGKKPVKKSEDLEKKEKPMAHLWLGKYPISDAAHEPLLEQSAAIHEFGHKLPRAEAEHKAYQDYVRGQREDAAAYHLRGLKAAQGAGDRDSAEKHGAMYQMHCYALGYEPHAAPHPSIVARMQDGKDRLYKFKAHRGDLYALPDKEANGKEPTKMDKSEPATKHEIGYALYKMLIEIGGEPDEG